MNRDEKEKTIDKCLSHRKYINNVYNNIQLLLIPRTFRNFFFKLGCITSDGVLCTRLTPSSIGYKTEIPHLGIKVHALNNFHFFFLLLKLKRRLQFEKPNFAPSLECDLMDIYEDDVAQLWGTMYEQKRKSYSPIGAEEIGELLR